MRCSSRIKINRGAVRELSQAAAKALEETAEALHTEVVQAQVIPRDTGALQGENFFCDYSESKSGRVSLLHSTPYARRLYFHPEYHFDTSENPNARGEWYEDWLQGGRKEKFVSDTFKESYRRNVGL